MGVMEKIKCSLCGEILPATSEYFTQRKNRKRGFASSCKICLNIKNKEKLHKEKERRYSEVTEKQCTYCLKIKNISEFRKRKDREFGVVSRCNECCINISKEYRNNNRDTIKEKQRKNKEYINERNRLYYKTNKEKILIKCKKYREDNIDKVRERISNYYKNNKYKYSLNSRRREIQLKNVSIDFGELSEFIISEIYELRDSRNYHTGIIWHVDHIVPLQSPLVCGLHCGFNLRVIPATENIKKGNRWWDGMPTYTFDDLEELLN